ncbi:AbrB/MazE/SpoVT family DNA-binding domain-containing protein [Candidatus Bathyarchaeota archaeon]|nr:AbrB/MazE/SpoVT family DNA-binding domain-containing protein [Candidatus Bathyarchaeota archaeon]
MTEVTVTGKGQITIPVELRRRFDIEEGSKVEVIEEDGKIVIRRQTTIFDLAGESGGKGEVDDLKKMLDALREENAQEEPL